MTPSTGRRHERKEVQNTVDRSVEVAGTTVVAVVQAAVIGPDPATGIAVRVRSGAVGGGASTPMAAPGCFWSTRSSDR
jgi:preprotein translocase subunit SecF